MSLIFNGIGQMMGDARSKLAKTQPNSSSTSIGSIDVDLSFCRSINQRLKAAKIPHEAVNVRYHQKYPDRPKKLIDPNNVNDRKLRAEWCQIAEELVAK